MAHLTATADRYGSALRAALQRASFFRFPQRTSAARRRLWRRAAGRRLLLSSEFGAGLTDGSVSATIKRNLGGMKKRRVLTNLVGQWLWRIAKPYAPRRAPVAPWIRLIHYWALRLSEPNPAKGKPPTLIRPGYYYDADLAQRLIDTGIIRTKPLTVNAPKYAFQQWTVTYQGGLLSQGDGSQADLIWVLTMPAERARKPVLFLEDPLLGAPKILDGSHRLIRSIVDGLSDIEVQVIEPADVQHILGRAQQA